MNPYLAEYLKWFFWGSLCTPRGLIVRAIYLVLLFGIVHLLGLREYTTFLSGTVARQTSLTTTAILGSVYALSYLAAILIAPILVMAAGLLKLWQHLSKAQY
jgi:hypothetical protein